MGRQIISTFLVICGLCVVCYQIRLHQGFFPVPRFSESGRDRFFSFLGAFFISIICSSWSLSLWTVLGRVLRRSIKFVLRGFFYMWIAFFVDVRELLCILCSMKRGHPPIPFASLPSLCTFTETRKLVINMKIIELKRKEGGFWRVWMITYCDQSLATGHAPICSNPFRHLRRRRHFHHQHHQDHQDHQG